MEIEFTKTAYRDFKKLSRDLQKRVIGVLLRVKHNPWKYAKKLQGFKNVYRIRVGDYRVIVKINSKIYVLKIAHRKHVYSFF